MKILTVIHDYLPAHVGGSEIHAHAMARLMRERGHETFAAFTERDLSAPEGEVRRGELDGVPTFEVVHHREYAHARETVRPPITPRVLGELLGELQPDLVHFHSLKFWGAECVEVAKRSGAAVVATLHDFNLICDNATLLRDDGSLCKAGPRAECSACLEYLPNADIASDDPLAGFKWREFARDRIETHRWFMRLADVIICPSKFLGGVMAEAEMVRPDQMRVLRAGYPAEYHPLRPIRRDGPLQVGYVGGIYASKGVHVLVDAMAHLEPGLAELHVHGNLEWFPDYVERLQTAAEGLPVTFHGPFEAGQGDAVMESFDTMVVPSIWYENMPLTLMEGFRSGVPPIVTGIGGMAESVRDGVDGLHFPRGDDAALAECIRRLARDRDLLERLAAGRPDPQVVVDAGRRLETIYGEALERASAGV